MGSPTGSADEEENVRLSELPEVRAGSSNKDGVSICFIVVVDDFPDLPEPDLVEVLIL